METILSIDHVSKQIGKREILHDVSLETYAGEVFGFLGPNGAGKTTTIKMVVGLLGIEQGSISICGCDVRRQFERAMANVGAIVENPELYSYLTGMQNLRQYARMRTGITQERIQDVVDLVGLHHRIHDKVRKYSLGMRQRLGVAQAILHRPRLLVLDEPTNGLDPAGIKELRDILKGFAHQEGASVLVSSHLMSEMELMCDRVGIISNGRMLGVRTIDELLSASDSGRLCYVFTVSDAREGVRLLAERWPSAARLDDRRLEVELSGDRPEEEVGAINALLLRGGLMLYGAAPAEHRRLEDAFIELTETGGTQID